MEIRTIVDAGPLIGWLNENDQWHEWSVAALSARRGPLHTTEIVLGEACWHLGGNSQPVHALLDLVRKGALILARPWPEHLAGTQQIMLKYLRWMPPLHRLSHSPSCRPKPQSSPPITVISTHVAVCAIAP